MIEFTKEEKILIKEEILKEVMEKSLKYYGDTGTTLKDIKVNWLSGYNRDVKDIKPHLNYVIPYEWRKSLSKTLLKQYPSVASYNENGLYLMSTLEFYRDIKLQELLKKE